MNEQDRPFKNADNYKTGYGKKTGEKPSWQERAKKDKEWANKTSDEMALAVSQDMKKFVEYLDVQSKFEMYSASNTLLILNQDKNATYLREFKKWKEDDFEIEDLNKKVIIVKPEPVKKEDGSTVVFYNAKRLFDVSNTNAPRLEEKEIPDKESILKSILNSYDWQVEVVDSLDNGSLAKYNNETNTIQICRGQDIDSKLQDIVQETAKKFYEIKPDDENKKVKQFKSTCVAYMFCKKFGIDFPADSFKELPNMLSGEAKEIKAELESIKDVYATIKDRMFATLEQERNKHSKEQER